MKKYMNEIYVYIALYLHTEMKPKEEYLRGIALITWNSYAMKKEVVAFPETDLPKDTEERFNALFKAKDKWTVEEITPYIL